MEHAFPNLRLSADALWLLTHTNEVRQVITWATVLLIANTIGLIALWQRVKR